MIINGGFAWLEVSGFIFNSVWLLFLKTGLKPDVTIDLTDAVRAGSFDDSLSCFRQHAFL